MNLSNEVQIMSKKENKPLRLEDGGPNTFHELGNPNFGKFQNFYFKWHYKKSQNILQFRSSLNTLALRTRDYRIQVSLAIHVGYVPNKTSNREYQNRYIRLKLGWFMLKTAVFPRFFAVLSPRIVKTANSEGHLYFVNLARLDKVRRPILFISCLWVFCS